MRGTSLSSNREDAALSQRRCGFESRRGYFSHVAYCCVCCGSFSVVTLYGWGWVWFSSLLPYLGSWLCFAPLAQLVEQETLNLRVVGSSATGGTLCSFDMLAYTVYLKHVVPYGCNSWVVYVSDARVAVSLVLQEARCANSASRLGSTPGRHTEELGCDFCFGLLFLVALFECCRVLLCFGWVVIPL